MLGHHDSSGASNDIEQATKLARAMVTRMGMSEQFDMMALETVSNPYLGGDTSLVCSADTAAQVDKEVLRDHPFRPPEGAADPARQSRRDGQAGRLSAGKGNHYRRRIYGDSQTVRRAEVTSAIA